MGSWTMKIPVEGIRQRATRAWALLERCEICPRLCRVNRLAGEAGRCRAGSRLLISSSFAHFGEESCLVGSHGSGTIFFTSCNLRCSFCQNYEISQATGGSHISFSQLADLMLELQSAGCHNINLVTPTHFTPHILRSIAIAAEAGLNVPIVWNTSGYERVETLRLLDGIVDIYMPDFKFWDSVKARRLARAPDYPEVARAALQEIHQQVGDLVINSAGVAERGLLVRHLVMPEATNETKEIAKFLASQVSPETFVNIMPQYRPCGEVDPSGPLGRRLTLTEYNEALAAAARAGIHRLAR